MEADLITGSKKIAEDESFSYYEYMIEGNLCPIIARLEKETGKCEIDLQSSYSAVGGVGSVNDFLSTDEGLDMINSWEKKRGTPFFQSHTNFKVPEHVSD